MSRTDPKQKVSEKLLTIDAEARAAAVPLRDTPSVKALSWFSELGDQPQMRTISAGLLFLGLVRADRRMASAGARMFLAHELATAAKNFVKKRVDRSRPRSAGDKEEQKPELGGSEAKEETSFPSGHSAGAASVARAFAREYPEHGAPALAAGAAVALAQIPRCAHYPTDVGAGIMIGLAAEAAVDAGWQALTPQPDDDPWNEPA
jgi:undecaprenyl-diphosphatase